MVRALRQLGLMRIRSCVVGCAISIGIVLLSGHGHPAFAGESSEAPPEGDAHAAEVDARTRGFRVHAGLFALGHAKRGDGASFSLAPGLSLAAAYRWNEWEFEVAARGAHFEQHFAREEPPRSGRPVDDIDLSDRTHDNRLTQFATGGLGARWFAARSASTSAFVGGGVDYMLFYWERSGCCADYLDGRGGFAAHASVGVELWHADAHARLAFEGTALFPTFRFRAGYGDDVYVVPVTLGARFVL